MLVLRQTPALRQTWLQHVASLTDLYLCRQQHTLDGADTFTSYQQQVEMYRRPHQPAWQRPPKYLSMGFGNKAFSLFFEKLRRRYKKATGPRNPEQVPFNQVYSGEFERLRRHNTLLPGLEGQTISCKVMAVGTYDIECRPTVTANTDKYRDLLWFDTGYKTHAKFYMRQLNIEDVVATKDGPLDENSPPKEEWEVGDVMNFVILVRARFLCVVALVCTPGAVITQSLDITFHIIGTECQHAV